MRAEAMDADRRAEVYRALERRNRRVGLLRLAVPVAGGAVFAVLLVQIVLSGLADRFSIGSLAVTPDSIGIAAPEYAGVLDDGARYRVWARAATQRLDTPHLLDLEDAALRLERPNGIATDLNAAAARLETESELVLIEGTTHVEDSTGTVATLMRSRFDWAAQTLASDGPVVIDYADGTRLEADALAYDAKGAIWTFSRVKVTLPDTPGTASP